MHPNADAPFRMTAHMPAHTPARTPARTLTWAALAAASAALAAFASAAQTDPSTPNDPPADPRPEHAAPEPAEAVEADVPDADAAEAEAVEDAETSDPSLPPDNPEARAALDALLARYASLTTYQDRCRVEMQAAMGRAETNTNATMSFHVPIAFERPGRLAVSSFTGSIVVNGPDLLEIDGTGGRYLRAAAPKKLWPCEFELQNYALSSSVHPLLHLLADHADGSHGMIGEPLRALALREEPAAANRPAHRVLEILSEPGERDSLTQIAGGGMMSNAPRQRVDLHLDPTTGLIASAVVHTEDQIAATRETLSENAGISIDFTSLAVAIEFLDIRVDQPIDPAVFSPDLSAMREVTTFYEGGDDTDSEDIPGAAFIHQPVPAFAAKDLNGADVSTESLKGSVVLLDFWATWCGPCVAAMPSVQELASEYADKGLVVIGINQDLPGQEQAVRDFLTEKAVTFTQVLDPEDAIAEKFDVSAIPTSVLIDRDGVVQAYHIGFAGKEAYKKEIEALLAGEALAMPTPEVKPTKPEGGWLAEVSPERLATAPGESPVSAWISANARLDGRDVRVMPHDAGGLAYLDPRGGTIQRIPFDDDASVEELCPVRTLGEGGEETSFFVATTAEDAQASNIRLVNARGRTKWEHRLELPAGADVYTEVKLAAGDLTGDGLPEFAALVGVTDGDSYETDTHVVVLDSVGQPITSAKVELDGSVGGVVIEPGQPGGRGTLFCFGSSRMVSVRLD